jgi:hypothetical protein
MTTIEKIQWLKDNTSSWSIASIFEALRKNSMDEVMTFLDLETKFGKTEEEIERFKEAFENVKKIWNKKG